MFNVDQKSAVLISFRLEQDTFVAIQSVSTSCMMLLAAALPCKFLCVLVNIQRFSSRKHRSWIRQFLERGPVSGIYSTYRVSDICSLYWIPPKQNSSGYWVCSSSDAFDLRNVFVTLKSDQLENLSWFSGQRFFNFRSMWNHERFR